MSFLVQLTDTHILEPGKLLYGKVDTAAHLADAVEQVNRMSPQPDLVMITGDLVEQPDADRWLGSGRGTLAIERPGRN